MNVAANDTAKATAHVENLGLNLTSAKRFAARWNMFACVNMYPMRSAIPECGCSRKLMCMM